MTPEEIQQVVEDYKKSNSLNEIFNDKTKNFLRNFGRNPKDKVNIEKDKEKNGNGAQGAQGAQSSSTGAQGTQGAQSNDNVGAQGNGAQSSTTTGAQGAQSNDNVGAQGTANGAQGVQNNTVKKNEIDLDAISKYSRKGKEVTIKDFGGLTGAQGAQTNEIKPTNPSGKVIPTPTKPLMTDSPAAKAGIPLDMRQKFANQNAAFQATKDKNSGYTKMDFIKDFPNSNTAKKFNKGENIPGFSYKKNLNNAYEPYHIVLGYVLSEGHAETVEEAHYVMGQMDSETIQEIVALDENLANVARTAGALTLGGMGLNAIRKMLQNKEKMDKGEEFKKGSTMDNIQKKNKMLDDFKTGNY